MAGATGLWGWVSTIGGSCGFVPQQKQSAMWVRAQPELTQNKVPGVDEELLQRISSHGGSLEEKIECMLDTFRTSARHLESLQTLLRLRAVEKREDSGELDALPAEVREVISDGNYLESFLTNFDGESFPLYAEEIVPNHEYRLALEVHSGGAYWSSIPVQDAATVVHKVETVGACSPVEGSASIVAQYGAAQRGAVFVWRWHYDPERGPYALPAWLAKVLAAEGADPLRKLQSELESIRRWEQQIRQETAQHVKAGKELKDPYIREVLRLWPTETDAQGCEQLKKCAWVEGLDSKLFVGRSVLIIRVLYDDSHSLSLHAVIAKRHEDQPAQENSPPYRLTTTWQWVSSSASQNDPAPSSSALPAGSAVSLASSAGLPGTQRSLSSAMQPLDLTSSRTNVPGQAPPYGYTASASGALGSSGRLPLPVRSGQQGVGEVNAPLTPQPVRQAAAREASAPAMPPLPAQRDTPLSPLSPAG